MGLCCCKTTTYETKPNGETTEQVTTTARQTHYAVEDNGPQVARRDGTPEGGWREMPVDIEGTYSVRAVEVRKSKGTSLQPKFSMHSETNATCDESITTLPKQKSQRTNHKTSSMPAVIDTSDTNFDPSLNLDLAILGDGDSGLNDTSIHYNATSFSQEKPENSVKAIVSEGFINPAFDNIESDEDGSEASSEVNIHSSQYQHSLVRSSGSQHDSIKVSKLPQATVVHMRAPGLSESQMSTPTRDYQDDSIMIELVSESVDDYHGAVPYSGPFSSEENKALHSIDQSDNDQEHSGATTQHISAIILDNSQFSADLSATSSSDRKTSVGEINLNDFEVGLVIDIPPAKSEIVSIQEGNIGHSHAHSSLSISVDSLENPPIDSVTSSTHKSSHLAYSSSDSSFNEDYSCGQSNGLEDTNNTQVTLLLDSEKNVSQFADTSFDKQQPQEPPCLCASPSSPIISRELTSTETREGPVDIQDALDSTKSPPFVSGVQYGQVEDVILDFPVQLSAEMSNVTCTEHTTSVSATSTPASSRNCMQPHFGSIENPQHSNVHIDPNEAWTAVEMQEAGVCWLAQNSDKDRVENGLEELSRLRETCWKETDPKTTPVGRDYAQAILELNQSFVEPLMKCDNSEQAEKMLKEVKIQHHKLWCLDKKQPPEKMSHDAEDSDSNNNQKTNEILILTSQEKPTQSDMEDESEDDLLEEYSQIMMNTCRDDDQDLENFHSNNENDELDASLKSDEDDEEITSFETTSETLQTTLMEDLVTTLTTMNADDFRDLMETYRNEYHVLGKSHVNVSDQPMLDLYGKVDKEECLSVDETKQNDMKTSEAQTNTDATLLLTSVSVGTETEESWQQEASKSHQVFLAQLDIKDDNKDDIERLFSKHLHTIESLRKQKQDNLSRYQERLEARLNRQLKEKSSENINDEAIEEIGENTTHEPQEIITKGELQDLWKYSNDFDKEMEEALDAVAEECIENLHTKDHIEEKELEHLLHLFEQQQKSLCERRLSEKTNLLQKLEDKLAKNKNSVNADVQVESKPTKQALKDIDDQFYDALKHAKEIKQSEDDIQSIVAMHLKRVDEFMNIMYPSLQKNHHKKKPEVDTKAEAELLMALQKQQKQKVIQLRHNEQSKVRAKLLSRLEAKKNADEQKMETECAVYDV